MIDMLLKVSKIFSKIDKLLSIGKWAKQQFSAKPQISPKYDKGDKYMPEVDRK